MDTPPLAFHMSCRLVEGRKCLIGWTVSWEVKLEEFVGSAFKLIENKVEYIFVGEHGLCMVLMMLFTSQQNLGICLFCPGPSCGIHRFSQVYVHHQAIFSLSGPEGRRRFLMLSSGYH